MKNLAKEIIAIDRIARKKIELLENEKKELPDFLRIEKTDKMKQYKLEVENEIKETKKVFEVDLKTKQANSVKDLNKRVKEIDDKYQKNRENWIDSLYEECLK